ncbi:MAG: tRNA1(Val) (adenine(37)-N6)-methyltransferase [Firmicutes bacterium]|nr:tRNA1(Val) (adenine(37)-N6)-methyltransferase [Bacillota bacterium]
METIDDTGFGGIRLIQETEGFRYGTDAVLLMSFARRCCPGAEKAVELGSGNGAVSLMLAGQDPKLQITGIEFQKDAVHLAQRSVQLNQLTERVSFVCSDILCLKERFPHLHASADLVVSNPPYVPRGGGPPASRNARQSARQETTAELEDFIAAAAWLLRGRGSFCMVHRPSRLVDIFYYCRKYRLEPKRIQFVHPRQGQPPNIVLLQCSAGGGKELVYDNPIYVH